MPNWDPNTASYLAPMNVASTAPPANRSHVSEALSGLDKRLEELERVTELLGNRLQPVLALEESRPSNPMPPRRPAAVPLAEQISDRSERCEVSLLRLRTLLELIGL